MMIDFLCLEVYANLRPDKCKTELGPSATSPLFDVLRGEVIPNFDRGSPLPMECFIWYPVLIYVH